MHAQLIWNPIIFPCCNPFFKPMWHYYSTALIPVSCATSHCHFITFGISIPQLIAYQYLHHCDPFPIFKFQCTLHLGSLTPWVTERLSWGNPSLFEIFSIFLFYLLLYDLLKSWIKQHNSTSDDKIPHFFGIQTSSHTYNFIILHQIPSNLL